MSVVCAEILGTEPSDDYYFKHGILHKPTEGAESSHDPRTDANREIVRRIHKERER